MTPRGRGEHLEQGRRLRRPLASQARERVVAIVGAGASGTLVAVNLLRLANVRVILIDPTEHGRGIAYATRDEKHLLNVPACGMSGLADDPDDLLVWCAERGMNVGRRDFLPRGLYGDYLRALLARFDRAGRVQLLRARVENVVEPPFHGGVRITLGDGSELSADAAVLAVGNAAPSPVRAVSELGSAEIVQDPWSPGELARLRDAKRVVIVGAGLSAVDVATSLASQDPDVRICAVSRHGRLPLAHAPQCGAPRELHLTPGAPLCEITRAVAAGLEREPAAWREVIDSMRPVTPALWQGLSVADRERFESDLRWWWDIHRHRLAPRAASRLADLVGGGRLEVLTGSVLAVGAGPDGALERASGRRPHRYRRRGRERDGAGTGEQPLREPAPAADAAQRSCPRRRSRYRPGDQPSGCADQHRGDRVAPLLHARPPAPRRAVREHRHPRDTRPGRCSWHAF